MNRKQFNALTSEKQWAWVISNKNEITVIKLDNDSTYVCADRFKEAGNDECDGSICTKSSLGNSDGIDDLLHALGIPFEGV